MRLAKMSPVRFEGYDKRKKTSGFVSMKTPISRNYLGIQKHDFRARARSLLSPSHTHSPTHTRPTNRHPAMLV